MSQVSPTDGLANRCIRPLCQQSKYPSSLQRLEGLNLMLGRKAND